jgi:hypothetical protein
MHTCNSSYLGGGGRRIESLRPAQEKVARPYLKNMKTEGLGNMVQVVDHLFSMHQALGSIPSTGRKKKELHIFFMFDNCWYICMRDDRV